MTTPAAETFGHEPVWINAGYCGGCERCGSTEEREVCARCIRTIRETDQPWGQDLVDWPCTSAIVLGLVDREPCVHSFPDPYPAPLTPIGDCRHCGIGYREARDQQAAGRARRGNSPRAN